MSLITTRCSIILSLIIGGVSANLHISHPTETKEVGDYLSVLCREQDNGATVTWKGPRNRVFGETTNPYVKMTTHGVHLIFPKLKPADSGVYTCRSERGETKQYSLSVVARENFDPEEIEPIEPPIYSKPTKIKPRPIFLSTYRPPTLAPPPSTKEEIEFADTPRSVTGAEGSNVFLKCEASGADEIEWNIDGEILQEDDPKYKQLADGLLIRNAEPEDSEKLFECKAIGTEAGSFAVRAINVTVTHAPRPRYEKQNVLYGYVNGYVNLTCEVEAVPPPTFKWEYKRRNKRKYKPIGQEVISSETTPTMSVLMLYLTENSFGDYKCIATNSEGEDDIQFSLEEGTQPSPPTTLEILNVTSEEVYLMIEEPETTAEENRTGMYPTGIRVELQEAEGGSWESWEFELDNDKTYIINNLTEDTSYVVQAATINAAGVSDYVNITFTTTSSANIVNSLSHLYVIVLIYCHFKY